MTARKKTSKKPGRKPATRKKKAGGARALSRLEGELPPTLRDFARRVRRSLAQLERDAERAQARTRRQAARLLREGSHRLGALEAQGERNWRKLSARARRETLSILRRLERAVERSAPARKKKTKASRPRRKLAAS